MKHNFETQTKQKCKIPKYSKEIRKVKYGKGKLFF